MKSRLMVKRMFGDIPVREAKTQLRVQPNATDIADAVRSDPCNCAYALCIKRVWDSKHVWIFNTIAYVQTLDEQGNPVIERFMIPAEGRAFINAVDRGEEVNPAGFMLMPPKGIRLLEAKAAVNKRYKKRHKAKSTAPRRKYDTSGLTRPGMGHVRWMMETEIKKR